MTIRLSKALLLFALGFYYALVVFNNTNDYNSNLTFVRHVLLMDTTFPGNHGMWRAIHSNSRFSPSAVSDRFTRKAFTNPLCLLSASMASLT